MGAFFFAGLSSDGLRWLEEVRCQGFSHLLFADDTLVFHETSLD